MLQNFSSIDVFLEFSTTSDPPMLYPSPNPAAPWLGGRSLPLPARICAIAATPRPSPRPMMLYFASTCKMLLSPQFYRKLQMFHSGNLKNKLIFCNLFTLFSGRVLIFSDLRASTILLDFYLHSLHDFRDAGLIEAGGSEGGLQVVEE